MTADDVLNRAAPPPDFVVSYGPGRDQVADVRLPALPSGRAAAGAGVVPAGVGTGPAPLVLFLHGGFWRAAYDRTHTGPLAAALAAAGFAVCTPEFRRTGQSDGGWPGTFDDVAAAVDRLPALVREAAGADVISSAPPVLGGHSAGGHLALWAAARHMIAPGAPWHAELPRAAGVVALAAVLLPLGCPVRLVHGSADRVVPSSLSTGFLARGSAAGDDVSLTELPGAGHFDVIDPLSGVWQQVVAAFTSLVPS